ncbi:hypothetical protein K9L67_00625 [Candidatus Woesearchaeota archaeon]|nr:hypothetical protein [Candidatus Woesearchaeota archaeon]MCF7900711.1 hypothetical protein [Candidatus Woesearchaeota archaeon]MCF8013232.1 hypothetical protein [Candidatus Woesearchaeota archaeon]
MVEENLSLSERLKILKVKEDEKKKELDDLKKKIDEESEEIKKEINETLRALREEEENIFREEDKKKKNLTIDEEVSDQKSNTNTVFSDDYSGINKKNVYELANRDSYHKFKDLIEKAQRGYASQTEINFISTLSNKLTEFNIEDSYAKKKDPDNYLARMQKLMNDFQK